MSGRERKISRKELRSRELFSTACGLKPDEKRKREGLLMIRQEVMNKKLRYTPKLWEYIKIQLQYISPFYWGIQSMIIILLFLFSQRINDWPKGHEQLLFPGITGIDRLGLISMGAVWLAFFSVGELGKHFYGRMAELEQSCYINLSQMWITKMILFGGVDILIFTACGIGLSGYMERSVISICVYLLAPFVLSCVGALGILSSFRGGRGRYIQLIAGLLSGIGALIPGFIPEAYKWNYLWVWTVFLVGGLVLLFRELRRLYAELSKGEILCWN